jgi:hypothetical protein
MDVVVMLKIWAESLKCKKVEKKFSTVKFVSQKKLVYKEWKHRNTN